MRNKIKVNENWQFFQGCDDLTIDQVPSIDAWVNISLPHTWNNMDGADGSDYFKGKCWYKKSLNLPDYQKNARVFIEFEGANSITEVFINNKYVGNHKGGYSAFRFDITEFLNGEGENSIAVSVDNQIVDDVYPQKADFTFFGGIYRDVHIIVVDPIHFDLMDYGSDGIFIRQDLVSEDLATLSIEARVTNDGDDTEKTRVTVEVFEGNTLCAYSGKEITIDGNTTQALSLPVQISEPKLWDGKKNPHLYRVRIGLTKHNEMIDEVTIKYGVRDFEVLADRGMLLNGKPYPLMGVSRHQDRMDKGWAISEEDQNEDMALIEEIGATSIRLAHYQHSQYFYNLCDEKGMVIWAEIPFISIMSKEELTGENAKVQLIELIRQNRNHPSIFFWGIHNEIQIGGERPEVRQVVKELNAIAKEEDATRLTTLANVMFVPEEDEFNHMTDIVGYNKYYGWYNGEAEDFDGWIDKFHEVNPEVPLCISEYGAEGIIEYHSDKPVKKDYTEEYHALYHEKVLRIFRAKPFLWATYVWNMFDFGANIRDEAGVQGRNNKGLVTYDRKIKKDAFYLYKAFWSEEKFVHIAGKRFISRKDHNIGMTVYSNCEKLSLWVNGDKVQTVDQKDPVFRFDSVAIKDGANHIRVVAEEAEVTLTDVAYFEGGVINTDYYNAPVDDLGSEVDNWFEMPEVADVVVEAIEIPEGVYSSKCTYAELLENEETKVIFKKYFGNIDEHPMFSMALGMTVDAVASMNPSEEETKRIYMLNKELIKIAKVSKV